jgi:hypothetical protein
MSHPIHFITYHTSDEKAKYLFLTASFHNIEIKNIAKSYKWVGLRDKLIGLRDFVNTLPPDDIVCFLDAYDGIVNANKEEFIEKFLAEKTEIVFGAEILCWPSCLSELKYPESHTPMRYLNSGFYIGYARALQKFVKNTKFEDFDKDYNDQEYFSRYFVENHAKENIKLDKDAKFVLNMNKVPWQALEIKNGYIHTTISVLHNRPAFVHFCGMSYLDINKDCIRQGDALGFNYHQVYDRTFIALLSSKMVTQKADVICHLTGRGMTY